MTQQKLFFISILKKNSISFQCFHLLAYRRMWLITSILNPQYSLRRTKKNNFVFEIINIMKCHRIIKTLRSKFGIKRTRFLHNGHNFLLSNLTKCRINELTIIATICFRRFGIHICLFNPKSLIRRTECVYFVFFFIWLTFRHKPQITQCILWKMVLAAKLDRKSNNLSRCL